MLKPDLNANGLPLKKGSVPIFFGTQTLVFDWFANFCHQSVQKPGKQLFFNSKVKVSKDCDIIMR